MKKACRLDKKIKRLIMSKLLQLQRGLKYLQTFNDCRKLRRLMTEGNFPYFTHKLSKEKNLKFVICRMIAQLTKAKIS